MQLFQAKRNFGVINAAAMDNFYDNYMNTIQSGSLADSTYRRLSSEPCVYVINSNKI